MKISSSMNGLSNMKFPLNGLLLIIMSLLPLPNRAQTLSNESVEAYPSAEFLEFLSEWETDSGEWAGSEQFEDDSFEQLFEDNENTDTGIEGVENAE